MNTTPWTRVSNGNFSRQGVVVARDRDTVARHTHWLPQHDEKVIPSFGCSLPFETFRPSSGPFRKASFEAVCMVGARWGSSSRGPRWPRSHAAEVSDRIPSLQLWLRFCGPLLGRQSFRNPQLLKQQA